MHPRKTLIQPLHLLALQAGIKTLLPIPVLLPLPLPPNPHRYGSQKSPIQRSRHKHPRNGQQNRPAVPGVQDAEYPVGLSIGGAPTERGGGGSVAWVS